MAYFGKFHKSLVGLAALATMFVFYSCKSEPDFYYPGDGQPDPDYADTIHVIREHTAGNGFPIIIMADGFTAYDISNGNYRKAVERADSALFAMEPMKSLKQYFDIIEVAVPSTDSVITSTAKNTAFKTHYATGGQTEVYGDSTVMEKWVQRALVQEYNITSQTTLKTRKADCQTIVLLNCTAYKGITIMTTGTTVTDSIPTGFAYSYIPAKAYVGTRDVFTDLIQHEAVGHGIGKLADEYFTPSATSPSSSVVTEFQSLRQNGYFANAAYDTEAAQDAYIFSLLYNNGYRFRINRHPLDSIDTAFPLTQDTRYKSLDIAWYQGGYTYLTYDTEDMPALNTYNCKKDFYRPSIYSIMNATTDANNKVFNSVSRLALYKRVMRAAFGSSFTCSLFNATDLEAFAGFDAAGRTEEMSANGNSSGAKAASSATVPDYLLSNDIPTLAPPIILYNPAF